MRAASLTEQQRVLKRCPFCAGAARLEPLPRSQSWWRVRCHDYGCGGTTWALLGPELAAATWNRRADGSH